MSPRPASASAGGVHAALASPTRRRLVELLQSDPTARDVHDLGMAVGLHPSTVRFHLETLRRAGLVVRQDPSHDGLGRPRTAYATAEGQHGTSHYEGLARLLAEGLSDTPDGRSVRAEQIGEEWARQLVGVPSQDAATADDAVVQVISLFERLGFAPEVRTSEHGRQIALRACPFRAVARDHPEVVCAVHLGLLRGSLTRLGASAAPRLVPFVKPELCMVHLGAAK
ncbi:MAG: ArsR family transcriptional regulator [Lapillicoccus sp.]